MDLSKGFVQFAQLGAEWVLWLLIILSVISIGVMIDRFLWFRARDADTDAFNRELRGAFARNEIERVTEKYKDSTAIPIQVALRGLAERTHGAEASAEAMHGERSRWRRTADKNLIVLGTLGNNVPFVGLFGTVLGVMAAFVELTLKDAEAEKRTLETIAEALSATAFGLFVAIPAVIAFNYFTRRIKVLMGGADECAHQVLSLIHAEAHAKAEGKSLEEPKPAPAPAPVR